ncbi:hypothetical protein [Blautia sp.]|uniref:hypothetical protein n=1 Tax=Blautia sp. TaxID=1955243 RepID=UPI0039936228
MSKTGLDIYVLDKISDIAELYKKIPYINRSVIYSLFNELTFPMTIVHDKYYVDRVYRDAYYTYFSNKHFEMPRNCQRLALFRGKFGYADFLQGNDENKHIELQDALIGTTVVKPTPIEHSNCTMGRTLLDPKKLKMPRCYVRTTKFQVCILGAEYDIDAFPFTGQDGEVMTCSETCIWEILEYFGTRYSNYRTVLPNDIIMKLNVSAQERILPSGGLTFLQVSDLLKGFGFEPRLYVRESYENELLTKHVNSGSMNLFKRIFHYYIESAIPLAVGLSDSVHEEHSVVCVGHGVADYSLKNTPIQKIGNLRLIDVADFYNKYVIIDDNQIPYRVEEYDHFSKNRNMQVQFLAVPLYKHIFLEADGAVEIISNFFTVYAQDIEDMLKEMGTLQGSAEPLVMRLFLTSSRNFKKFRIKNAQTIEEKLVYSEMNYPKFIWVCEFSAFYTYTKEEMVNGEIVLDATAFSEVAFNSIIAVRIGRYIGYRTPSEKIEVLFKGLEKIVEEYDIKYPLYKNNLRKGGFWR